MEAAGDSSFISGDHNEHRAIEFERNLDEFAEKLEIEENRLSELEKQQQKLLTEIEGMLSEVADEKAKHRKALDIIIEEREKMSRQFIDSCKPADVTECLSSMSLLDDCTEAIEKSKSFDDVGLDIEKIRCDLMENYICTTEDYLSTVKDHIVQKKKHLDDQTIV